MNEQNTNMSPTSPVFAPKKSNKTLAVVVIIVVILLAGTAVAAYYMNNESYTEDAAAPGAYTQINGSTGADYQPAAQKTDSSTSIENDLNSQSANSLDETTY